MITKLLFYFCRLVYNGRHCLQWRTCQTKSDVSALLLLLNYTALQRQPPAIEAMLSVCPAWAEHTRPEAL